MKKREANHTVEEFRGWYKRGALNFANPIQRPSGQWDYGKQSLLIDSMLRYFVPPVYVYEHKEKDEKGKNKNIKDVIDGKQRLTTMIAFLEDEIVLTDIPRKLYISDLNQDFELNGCRFSDLPEPLQEKIKGYSVKVECFEAEEGEDPKEIVEEIFYRLNNGTQVSKEHLAFIKSKKSLQQWARKIVSTHPLFVQDGVSCFPASRIRKGDREFTILQSVALCSGLEFRSFSAKDLQKFFTVNDISQEVLDKVEQAFDKIAEAFNYTRNKFVTKISISTMCTLADKPRFAEFINKYTEVSEQFDPYRINTGVSSTKLEKVKGRVDGLTSLYEQYITLVPAPVGFDFDDNGVIEPSIEQEIVADVPEVELEQQEVAEEAPSEEIIQEQSA